MAAWRMVLSLRVIAIRKVNWEFRAKQKRGWWGKVLEVEEISMRCWRCLERKENFEEFWRWKVWKGVDDGLDRNYGEFFKKNFCRLKSCLNFRSNFCVQFLNFCVQIFNFLFSSNFSNLGQKKFQTLKNSQKPPEKIIIISLKPLAVSNPMIRNSSIYLQNSSLKISPPPRNIENRYFFLAAPLKSLQFSSSAITIQQRSVIKLKFYSSLFSHYINCLLSLYTLAQWLTKLKEGIMCPSL